MAHPLAGQRVPEDMKCNIPRLITAYFTGKPDIAEPSQKVSFGTSGHRGVSSKNSFNETHILAISQAVADFRAQNHIDGPLFIGMDTHALSEPALQTAIEVLAANGVELRVHKDFDYTPTPVISHAILTYNRGRASHLADGIVITPSHNPPDNGGFKYNPPHGGPADTSVTKVIQDRANELIACGLKGVKRMDFSKALHASTTQFHDYVTPYVEDLKHVVDMDLIRESGLSIGVDPMGGSGIHFWRPIAERYGLKLTLVRESVDPTFSFMRIDKDGKIRMDCSSPAAMAGLIELKDRFDIAFGNDPDYDRHGIVTRDGGLMNPNHYLATTIDYLFRNRPGWSKDAAVGKTLVSSAIIDRVAANLGRRLCEVPVGFKWFVDGLVNGTYGFGGEESAGASFLRLDGTAWTTDKDGIILDLCACESTAKTGKTPSERYRELTDKFGAPVYDRIDAPADASQKKILANLSPEQVKATELAGEAIQAKLTHAPGNGAAIGGLKVVTQNGWFAARPSGTEDVYKIYAESFLGADHLKKIQTEAQEIVADAFQSA